MTSDKTSLDLRSLIKKMLRQLVPSSSKKPLTHSLPHNLTASQSFFNYFLLFQHLLIVSMSVTLIIGRERSHDNPY